MTKYLLTLVFAVLALVAPAGASFGQTVIRDVAYGDLARQKLDIYMPPTLTADTPVLVFFYGGGWQTGDKGSLGSLGKSFAEAGVIFVAPDYRIHPDAVFPNFIQDSARAVAHAWSEIRTDSGRARPVFVGGWSAGAYNAALIALDHLYLAAFDMPNSAVNGLIGLAGPYEGGMCAGARCEDVFPEKDRAHWSIRNHFDRDDPPALLIVGEKDEYVPILHLEGMVMAARAAGVPVATLEVPDTYHRKVLQLLADRDSDVRMTVEAFIADRAGR